MYIIYSIIIFKPHQNDSNELFNQIAWIVLKVYKNRLELF